MTERVALALLLTACSVDTDGRAAISTVRDAQPRPDAPIDSAPDRDVTPCDLGPRCCALGERGVIQADRIALLDGDDGADADELAFACTEGDASVTLTLLASERTFHHVALEAVLGPWLAAAAYPVEVVIDEGARIGGSAIDGATSQPALSIGALGANRAFTLTVRGTIQGRGGSGGLAGACNEPSVDGEPGGPAISVGSNAHVVVAATGRVLGGGGGGGGAGETCFPADEPRDSACGTGTCCTPGGGGGGGAGEPPGQGGTTFSGGGTESCIALASSGVGATGTATTGGLGGGMYGGAGGDAGAPGKDGKMHPAAATIEHALGGAAGPAISSNTAYCLSIEPGGMVIPAPRTIDCTD